MSVSYFYISIKMESRRKALADLACGLMYLLLFCEFEVKVEGAINATCKIEANSGIAPVYGTVKLYQTSADSQIQLDIVLKGFDHSVNVTQHGFHVHEHSGLGNKCNDAGAHYNPFNKTHGGPSDTERHVGDLGNVEVDRNGEVNTRITDQLVSLFGEYTVLNRAIVVHERFDDLGKGTFNDSKTTGHAGARFGCCIILKDEAGAGTRWSSVPSTVGAMLILASLISLY